VTVVSDPVTIIPAGTWNIDPVWSSVEFAVRKLALTTIKGRAGSVTGVITGGESPTIEGTVEAASITTFDEQRDAHLASPDFFDVARYPELRFVSTGVRQEGDEVVVRGELTIKGATRPVELRGELTGPANDPWGNERIGLELHATVDRTEFGLQWNAPLPGGGFLLPDDIELSAIFAAVKAA
jgi:polyisoprenoid-binding protein YceI